MQVLTGIATLTGLEWEVVNVAGALEGRRAVRVTLVKSTPRSDMVHW